MDHKGFLSYYYISQQVLKAGFIVSKYQMKVQLLPFQSKKH